MATDQGGGSSDLAVDVDAAADRNAAIGDDTAGAVPGPAAPQGKARPHGLRRYISRRLIQAAVVLFVVVTLVFGMSHLAANPVNILLPPGASPQDRLELTKAMGLDRPLIVQYGIFLNHVIHGDLGTSTMYHVPVLPLVFERAVPTVRLAIVAVLWAALLGVPLGVYLARRQGSLIDRFVGVLIALAQGVASFWLGIMLVFAFSVSLGWLPVSGDSEASAIILPAVSLGLAPFVSLVRLTRSAMIETLASEYVRNARARGVKARILILRHALRCALPPVITYGGILFGQLISGAVITETIFAWPGIGQLSVLGISNGDYALVEGVTLISASAMIVMNLLVDVIYLGLSPKTRDVVMVDGKL